MRRFTPDDGALFVELDSDPEVVRYVGHPEPTTLARVEQVIWPRIAGQYARHPHQGAWATHEIAGGAFIGWFFCRPTNEPPHELELGYRLRRASWNKGYATEGSRALLTHAFDVVGEKRVVAEVSRENRASMNVMKKLGMVFEREELEDGKPIDWYAIDARAWNAARR